VVLVPVEQPSQHPGGPPGQDPNFVPPGHGGVPPGQEKKASTVAEVGTPVAAMSAHHSNAGDSANDEAKPKEKEKKKVKVKAKKGK
jgi:hypothetical protein